MSLHILSDLIDWTVSVDFFDLALLLVEIDHWLGLIIENLQPLHNRFFIVVRSPTCLPPLQQPLLQLLLSAFEVEHRFEVHPLRHHFLPHIHVFLASGEAVEQVPASIVVPFDFFLDDPDHEIAGDQLALLDDPIDFLAQFGSSFDFLPQQISSGEMNETILLD